MMTDRTGRMAARKTARKCRAAANPNATGPVGIITRAAGKHGPQLIETQGRFWSDEAEATFLDTLAATCNVTRAAAAAGFSGTTVWRRRRRDAGFAARWLEALAEGYVRLETAMIHRAADRFDGTGSDDEGPAVSTAEAINLLRLHKGGVTDGRARGGRRVTPRPLADVCASILVKLEAIVAMTEADAHAAAAAKAERPDG